MRKAANYMIAIALLVSTVFALFAISAQRRSIAKRKQKDASYAVVIAGYVDTLHPGMTRLETRKYLDSHSISFVPRRVGAIEDDLIFISREPSDKFYCSWQRVSAKIEYKQADRKAADPSIEDRLQDVELDRWLQDCM